MRHPLVHDIILLWFFSMWLFKVYKHNLKEFIAHACWHAVPSGKGEGRGCDLGGGEVPGDSPGGFPLSNPSYMYTDLVVLCPTHSPVTFRVREWTPLVVKQVHYLCILQLCMIMCIPVNLNCLNMLSVNLHKSHDQYIMIKHTIFDPFVIPMGQKYAWYLHTHFCCDDIHLFVSIPSYL